MTITDDLLERAYRVHSQYEGSVRESLRAALEHVEAELCAKEPGPFVLSEREQEAYDALKQRGSYDRADVQVIIDRALRTLGPQPAQGGEHGMCVEVGAAKALEERAETAEETARKAEHKESLAWDAVLEALGAVTTTGTLAQCIAHLGRELKRERDMRKSHETNIAAYRKEIERIRELESAKPVAQELSKDDASFLGDCEADLAFGDSLTRDEYARLVAIIRNHFPKPAPISLADPVQLVLEEMRVAGASTDGIHTSWAQQTTKNWLAKLEAALKARQP